MSGECHHGSIFGNIASVKENGDEVALFSSLSSWKVSPYGFGDKLSTTSLMRRGHQVGKNRCRRLFGNQDCQHASMFIVSFVLLNQL